MSENSTAPALAAREVELLRAMLGRVDQSDPAAFNNLGVLYHTRGMYNEAVDAFLRALALEPRMYTAGRNLEIAAASPGACDAQLEELNARVEADPDDLDAVRARARLLRLIGRFDEAIRQLDALIAENPEDGAALLERGLIEQRGGDLRRAQRWLERAINAGARENSFLHLAEVQYQRGLNEQALATIEGALLLQPHDADLHRLHGFVLGDMGHQDLAMAAMQRATDLNPGVNAADSELSIDARRRHSPVVASMLSVEPDGALAHYGLGLAFRQRGYFHEARLELDRAWAVGEDRQLVLHAMAELDLMEGRAVAARVRYDELLAHSNSARWWNEYGVASHQAGDLKQAAQSYREALRMDPRYALAYNNLAVALHGLGDAEAAAAALRRVAELDPSLVLARRNLAYLMSWRGELAAALSLLRELVAFHQNDPDVWFGLGVVLMEAEKFDEARDALSRVVRIRPGHAAARFALAETLDRLGDAEGALRETEQALRLSAVRPEVNLCVGIDLQRESPDVIGAIDLLRLGRGMPLTGVELADKDIGEWLPERHIPQPDLSLNARMTRLCDEADDLAGRTLYGEAVERYARALELSSSPECADTGLVYRAALGEARAWCLLGRAAAAGELLARLYNDSPDDPEVMALLAAVHLAASDESGREAATVLLRRVHDSAQAGAALLHYSGDLACHAGNTQLALSFYRRALTRDPLRPTPRLAIAAVLRRRGDLAAALLEISAALALVPAWREARSELARIHRDAGRHAEARLLLVQMLLEVPTDLEALVLLAGTLVAEERDDDARVAVTRLQHHDPMHPAAMWFEGVLLARQARLRDALARWRQLAMDVTAGEWRSRAEKAIAEMPDGWVPPAVHSQAAACELAIHEYRVPDRPVWHEAGVANSARPNGESL